MTDLRSHRRHRALACALAFALAASPTVAPAVTLDTDPQPHLWHSSQMPANAFEGAAGIVVPAWQSSDLNALYVEWGGFQRSAPNSWTFVTPTVGKSATTTAVLKETSGTGMLLGNGNIYGLAFGQVPGPPLVFELTVTDTAGASHAAGLTRTVVMRSGTRGMLPDMAVTLNGVPANGSVRTFAQETVVQMPDASGNVVDTTSTNGEWLWWWAHVPVGSSYRFDFRAQMGHMSLDNLAVYASPPSLPPTLRAPVGAGYSLAGQLAAIAVEQTSVIARAGAAAAPRS